MAVGLVAVVALGATMGAIVMQTRQDSWNYPEAVAGALFLLVGAVFPLAVLPAVAPSLGSVGAAQTRFREISGVRGRPPRDAARARGAPATPR